MDQVTDLDFASRCAGGDRSAQRELFDRELDHVHATLYRILGPNRDLEDLAQEVFLEVFRSLASYRGEAKLATWIARVTAHVAFRYLGRRGRPTVWLESVPERAAGDPSAERQLAARRALRRMYEILGALDPAVRIAFALAVIDERPLDEVATVMQASLVATKSRVWRARRRLRRDPIVCAFLDGTASAEVGP
jgi:RNA polymerase sigma-70 factor (ECF subfamily)